MANKKKNTPKSKRNRRRFQIRIIKLILLFIVLLLPCVWLVGNGKSESEPMRVSRAFVDHLIHARYNEACALATSQSIDDILFYADWRGLQAHEIMSDSVRFKITHAQLFMPTDTTNVVQGKVVVMLPEGEEKELHGMELKLVYTPEGWLVDYDKSQIMWR
ncbi:MAG: hypothetical protein E7084_07215 [Bacteroidales bacterium]|nr:hypothetical protein [Bacteroidales bacterium]